MDTHTYCILCQIRPNFLFIFEITVAQHILQLLKTQVHVYLTYIVYSFLLGKFHCGFIQFSNILNARTWYHACWSPFRYGKSGIYAAFQLECILYQSLTSQNRISFQSYNVGTVLIGLNSTLLPWPTTPLFRKRLVMTHDEMVPTTGWKNCRFPDISKYFLINFIK